MYVYSLKSIVAIIEAFTVLGLSGTRNPGGGGGGANGMLDKSELVEVTFLRRSASTASRLLLPLACGGSALLAESVKRVNKFQKNIFCYGLK